MVSKPSTSIKIAESFGAENPENNGRVISTRSTPLAQRADVMGKFFSKNMSKLNEKKERHNIEGKHNQTNMDPQNNDLL